MNYKIETTIYWYQWMLFGIAIGIALTLLYATIAVKILNKRENKIHKEIDEIGK